LVIRLNRGFPLPVGFSPLEEGILTMNIATDGFAVHEGLYPEIIPSRTQDLNLSSRLQGGYNLCI